MVPLHEVVIYDQSSLYSNPGDIGATVLYVRFRFDAK